MAVRPALFISYRRSQAAAVRPVVAALERTGIDCFFDQDDIDPLADFPERVRQGIDASHAMLVWWSADYGDSDHCLAELRRAWQHARRRSSDVGRRIWVLNPEKEGHHIFAGELNAKNFLVPPAVAEADAWAQRLRPGLEAVLPEGPLADERAALAPGALRNVPTPNARFTGRGATLLRIHSKLFPPQIGAPAGANAVWLHGMGGLGKTEVAAKYAHDFAHAYPGGVFWLSFAGFEPDTPLDPAAAEFAAYRALEGAFAREPELQMKLLRDAEGKPLPWKQARARVGAWLAQPSSDGAPPVYLWVLDNVPLMTPRDVCARVLDGWKAPTPAGRTLLTTRDRRVADGFAEERMEELGEVDTLRLLARFRPIPDAERGEAKELAREVGRHTIALMLLGHRVAADGDYAKTLGTLRVAGRLDRLEQIAGRLQRDLGAAARSVVATFELSIASLNAEARRLLALISICAPNEAISRGLLRQAFSGDELGDEFAGAVTDLFASSLIGERRGKDAVDIHPLIADVASRLLYASIKSEGEEIAHALIDRIEAPNDIRTHPSIAADITHARHLFFRLCTPTSIGLGFRLGSYHFACGQFAEAAAVFERALRFSRAFCGSDHPETLAMMGSVANTRTALGDSGGGVALHEEILRARRRLLGDDDPSTLTTMINLADALHQNGNLSAAHELQKAVVETRRRVLGDKDPATLRAMHNLSCTLMSDPKNVERLFDGCKLCAYVVKMRLDILGKSHRETLSSISAFAQGLADLGDFERARRFQEEAVERLTRVLGETHPDRIAQLAELARIQRDQGDLRSARLTMEHVLTVRRRVLGDNHPSTFSAALEAMRMAYTQGDQEGIRNLIASVPTLISARLMEWLQSQSSQSNPESQ